MIAALVHGRMSESGERVAATTPVDHVHVWKIDSADPAGPLVDITSPESIVAFEGVTAIGVPAGWTASGTGSFDSEHAVITSSSGGVNLLTTPVPRASTRRDQRV